MLPILRPVEFQYPAEPTQNRVGIKAGRCDVARIAGKRMPDPTDGSGGRYADRARHRGAASGKSRVARVIEVFPIVNVPADVRSTSFTMTP